MAVNAKSMFSVLRNALTSQMNSSTRAKLISQLNTTLAKELKREVDSGLETINGQG